MLKISARRKIAGKIGSRLELYVPSPISLENVSRTIERACRLKKKPIRSGASRAILLAVVRRCVSRRKTRCPHPVVFARDAAWRQHRKKIYIYPWTKKRNVLDHAIEILFEIYATTNGRV